jgi:hypothetical protein
VERRGDPLAGAVTRERPRDLADERANVDERPAQRPRALDDERDRPPRLALDAEAREQRAVEVADEVPAVDDGVGRREARATRRLRRCARASSADSRSLRIARLRTRPP